MIYFAAAYILQLIINENLMIYFASTYILQLIYIENLNDLL